MRIDVHSHYIPPAYMELVREEGNPYGRHLAKYPSGEPALFGDNRLIPLLGGFHDVEIKLVDMKTQGVDMHVVSPPPFLFQYDLPLPLGEEVARFLNDEAHALEKKPRQVHRDGDCAASGARGSSGRARSGRWQAGDALGRNRRERMNDYYLFNLIGFLVETTLAAARMIFSGTLERYPDLKLCLSHSGGMALWTQGRLDHGFSAIPACQGVIDRPPSEYLKRMYFDTIAHRPEALRYVADIVGAGRIVMGTDYLFHVADPDPVKTVASIPGLTGDERASIEGSLAAYLLGLES